MAVWRIFNEPQQRRRRPSERRLRTADEHWEAPSRPCTVGGSRGGQAVLSHSVFYVVMSDVYAMSRTCVSTPGLVCFPVSVLSNVWSSRCFRRGECPCAGLLFTKGWDDHREDKLHVPHRGWKARRYARKYRYRVNTNTVLVSRENASRVSMWVVYMLSMSMCNIVVSVVFVLPRALRPPASKALLDPCEGVFYFVCFF